MRTAKIALVDDHQLFRKGLRSLIETIKPAYSIIFEASNGIELQQRLHASSRMPDIILLDMEMPLMDGFETVKWLNEFFPSIKVLVVSMIQKEESIVKMLTLGVKGYLSKDVEPAELSCALEAVLDKGFYYTDQITGSLINSLKEKKTAKPFFKELNEREKDFLRLACSEFTYQEIADKMFLSIKTIDGYRKTLFEKLNVKNRVGLAIYAIKTGLVVV